MPASPQAAAAQPDFFGEMFGGIANLLGDITAGVTGNCQRDDAAYQSRAKEYVSTGKMDTLSMEYGRHSRTASREGSRNVSREGSRDSRSSQGSRDMMTFGSGLKPARSRSNSMSRSPTPTKSRGSSRSPSVERESSGDGGNVTLFKAEWKNFELFKLLDDKEMKKCISKMKVRTCKLGDTIIKRGSIGTSMFFIDLGTARAEIHGKTATQLKSGDFFGEIAFIATCKRFVRDKNDTEPPEQAVRVADVVATAPCRILELSVKDFVTVLQNNKEVNRAVLNSLADVCKERKANVKRMEKAYTLHKEKVRDTWDGLSMRD